MTVLDKVEKYNHGVIKVIEVVGFAGLFAMMCITCIDVVGAKIFLHPVHGALDTVELAQLVAISFAAAAALLYGRHVKVEFFVALLPKRLQALTDLFAHGLGLFLFVLLVWQLIRLGHFLHLGREVSATARIPLFPLVYGAAFALIPLCVVFLLEMIKSFSRMVKK